MYNMFKIFQIIKFKLPYILKVVHLLLQYSSIHCNTCTYVGLGQIVAFLGLCDTLYERTCVNLFSKQYDC
jgi:hypothetical protein